MRLIRPAEIMFLIQKIGVVEFHGIERKGDYHDF